MADKSSETASNLIPSRAVQVMLRRGVDPGRELPGLRILACGNGREPGLTGHLDEEVVRLAVHRPLQEFAE